MKKLMALILVFFGSIVLISCQNSKPSNEFTIATWAAGTELAEFNAIVKQVNEEAEGKYVIKVQSIPSDYYIKLSTQIAARKAPEFFWLTQELIAKYAHLGAITDLTPYLDKSENLTVDDYYEGVIKSAYFKEKYWGLPWIANPFIVYYNKTMFEALEVTPPSATDDWTWDDFIAVSRQIAGKQYRNKSVFATVIEGNPNIETFIWSGGGDILADDGKTVILDSVGTKRGVGNLVTLFRENLIPRYNSISYARNVYFERQEVAMYMGGIQDDFERKISLMPENDKFELGYAPIPSDPTGQSNPFDWTASTVMSQSVKDKDLAYEALEALTLAFFRWKIAPPIKGTIENIPLIAPDKEAALPTIQHALEHARSAKYTEVWTEISDLYLWRGLYLPILQNPDVDYEDLIDKAAAGMRNKIGT
ncbi:extracellular solute-binding protein [Acholeplasma hippikon]|uniref:Maltose ABC transporter periplasmic protein n=1 Tax=Acholeplasma hippikon TaxID=264636 RepID=A0A449BIY4_9MOLU|nr:extracellular solute-binding protein [Acholeplasma hippikon]VEU82425.1 maltose ABC transporter periplasmic protein [Acholeplasma hippikon]